MSRIAKAIVDYIGKGMQVIIDGVFLLFLLAIIAMDFLAVLIFDNNERGEL